jgi:hypothetical protein
MKDLAPRSLNLTRCLEIFIPELSSFFFFLWPGGPYYVLLSVRVLRTSLNIRHYSTWHKWRMIDYISRNTGGNINYQISLIFRLTCNTPLKFLWKLLHVQNESLTLFKITLYTTRFNRRWSSPGVVKLFVQTAVLPFCSSVIPCVVQSHLPVFRGAGCFLLLCCVFKSRVLFMKVVTVWVSCVFLNCVGL